MAQTVIQFIEKATNGKVFEKGGSNQNSLSKVGQQIWINQIIQPITQMTVMYASFPS